MHPTAHLRHTTLIGIDSNLYSQKTLPDGGTVTIETDCSCVVVYTEPEAALCVEPQSGPPDALNLAPHVVTPDAPLVVHTTFDWAIDG